MASSDLEIDVGTAREGRSEFGISEDVLPLAGAVLLDAAVEGVFFLSRPLLFLISHHSSLYLIEKESESMRPTKKTQRKREIEGGECLHRY